MRAVLRPSIVSSFGPTAAQRTSRAVPIILSQLLESWPGSSRPSTSFQLTARKKDVDAREDAVPAAYAAGSLCAGMTLERSFDIVAVDEQIDSNQRRSVPFKA